MIQNKFNKKLHKSQFLMEQFLNEIDWEGEFSDVSKKTMNPHDIIDYLNAVLDWSKLSKSEKDKMHYEGNPKTLDKPYIHPSKVPTEDEVIDLQAFIIDITKDPSKIVSQNTKMKKGSIGNRLIFNVGVPAIKGLVYDTDSKEFYYVNTCPGAGSCMNICYATKGSFVQYPDVFINQTRILNLLLNNPAKFRKILELELETIAVKNPDKEILLRWNDSGDFFARKYAQIAKIVTKSLADKGYNFKSYAYTKLADVYKDENPENFIMTFSDGANKKENKKMGDTVREKESVVIPKSMFIDLIKKNPDGKYYKDEHKRTYFKNDQALDTLKDRLVAKYNVDKDSIVTHDEFLKIKEDPKSNKQYNVIIMPSGDSDYPASRKDVHYMFLLYH